MTCQVLEGANSYGLFTAILHPFCLFATGAKMQQCTAVLFDDWVAREDFLKAVLPAATTTGGPYLFYCQ